MIMTENESDVLIIAKACHEANRAYCEAVGDYSQLAWVNAPQWVKNSAVDGVAFLIKNPTAIPEDSHKNWLAHKEAEGWRYGPVKDADKKEHPCFVPYDELPVYQRMKDTIFHAVVRGIWQEFLDRRPEAAE